MEAKHRGPSDACLGRDTWGAAVAPEATISSASTGVVVGPATTRRPVNKAWVLNARNHEESVKEEDDKILSLGMPMHPKEKEIEEKEIGRAHV